MFKSIFFNICFFFIVGDVYASHSDALKTYDKTVGLITKHFYDQTFRGLPWSKLVQEHRNMLSSYSSDEDLSLTLNKLLNLLNTSHTEFLTSSDQEYWGLKSIFSGKIDGAKHYQVGAWFVQIDGKWFVRNVFRGSPAAKVGLLVGDEIISVNGKQLRPVDSFSKNKEVTLKVKRTQSGHPFEVRIKPKFESIQRSLLKATKNSYQIISAKDKKIAYFHLWSGTNDSFKDLLAKAALQASIESNAFILDLRDGFGGAYPEYLDPFFKQGDKEAFYSKPLFVLINDGVRSGKEWLTYILKQRKRAILIGTRTKGYFLAGQPFEIEPNRFLLYLAVQEDPTMPKLEGNGVSPDIEVKLELKHSQGVDPVMYRALQLITK